MFQYIGSLHCLNIEATNHVQSTRIMRVVLLAAVLVGAVDALTIMPPTSKTADHIPLAKKAIEFLDRSPDPFHVVQTAIDLLLDAGFEEVQDIEPNSDKIQPGRRHTHTYNKCETMHNDAKLHQVANILVLQEVNTTLPETSQLLWHSLSVEAIKQVQEDSK